MEPLFAHRPAEPMPAVAANSNTDMPSARPADLPDAEHWMELAFTCPTALKGGVIKRSLDEVDRIVGRERFLAEVRRHGFQAIQNRNAIVIFCNGEPVRLAAARAPLILR